DTTYGKIYKKGSGDGTNTGWEEFSAGSGGDMAKMTRSTTQSIPTGVTPTKIAFDTEVFDNGGIADAVTNDRFTIKKAGKYLITAQLRMDSMADNDFVYTYIYKNGSNVNGRFDLAGSGGWVTSSNTTTLDLAVNDYIELYTVHGNAGSKSTSATGNENPEMSVVQLDASGGGNPEVSVRAYSTVAHTIATSTSTALTFNQERYDTSAIHSTSSNTSRFTAPTKGKYLITGSTMWVANASVTRRITSIFLNNTTFLARSETTPAASTNIAQNVATVYELNAGDYVELLVFQNSGGNIDTVASDATTQITEFSMTKIDGGVSSTLQAAYDSGNTITSTDARDILFTLADTTTDSNYTINLAGAGDFSVQDAGSQALLVNDSGVVWVGSGGTSTTATGNGDLYVQDAAEIDGILTVGSGIAYLGVNDTGAGGNELHIYGGGAGAVEGGQLTLYTSADYDTTIDSYTVDVNGDSFRIFPTGGGVASLLLNTGGIGARINYTQSDDADATDTNSALDIAVTNSSGDADTLRAINIGDITAGAATEIGFRVGTGWDTDILLSDSSPTIAINNAGTLTLADGAGNSLLTLADAGSTGNVVVTGTTTVQGTGTALTLSGAATTALSISNTGTTTDISLQNGETIDNNVNGTLQVTATTTALSGTLTVSGASINLGASDTGSGDNTINVYGGGAGAVEGGQVVLFTSADYDTTIDSYALDVREDDFRIHSAGTLRVTLSELGYLGIGQDQSPSVNLHVCMNSGGCSDPTGGFRAGTGLAVQNNGATSDSARFALLSGTAAASTVEFGDSAASPTKYIQGWNSAAAGAHLNDFTFVNSANAAGIIEIDSSGRISLGLGDAAVDSVEIVGNLRIGEDGAGANTTGCLKDGDGTTLTGTCLSDSRLKTNVLSLNSTLFGTDLLNRFTQLRPVTFEYNSLGQQIVGTGTQTEIGLIAQEVEALFPNLVSIDSTNGYKQIATQYFDYLAIQAIKELKVVTDNLEDRLAVVETGEFAGNLHVNGDVQFDGNLAVTGDATLTKLIVTGETEVQQLTVNGKIITAGVAPTAVLGAQANGDGAVITLTGNDTAGTISYEVGAEVLPTNPLAIGEQVNVDFAVPYTAQPRVTVSPTSEAAAKVRYYIIRSTTGFKLVFVDTPVTGQTYSYDYQILQ
ncbi:MAG: tail fiber domain-containing protein, partial [Candidatus Saccharibacteria bacterium]|nr:tail fiber domain-containing protein [Candidatus Saccharibacteria bacterium]